MILQKLGSVEILFSARRVCKTWRNICKTPAMWRVIDIVINEGDEIQNENKRRRGAKDIIQVRKLCREAVDLSQGELIAIEVVADDELINYIAQRSPKLRSLRLNGYYEIFSEALSEAVKLFPLLEEVQLIYGSIDDYSIQPLLDIARSCPLLTSFSFNTRGVEYQEHCPIPESNEVAYIVSRMHKLRHLQLFGSNMTNEGLTAILIGCSQLESLDLRKCRNLELDGELGKQCSQQIKYLRLPNDPIEDYPFFYVDAEDIEVDEESEDNLRSESRDENEVETILHEPPLWIVMAELAAMKTRIDNVQRDTTEIKEMLRTLLLSQGVLPPPPSS